MSPYKQKILAVLNPYAILQVLSICIVIWWLALIVIGLFRWWQSDTELEQVFRVYLVPGMIFIISAFFWSFLNTVNTTVIIRADGILMRGFFWNTYIPWTSANQIVLIYNHKARSHAVEVKRKYQLISWNNKVSFDSSLHRKVRRGAYYVIAVAEQRQIPIKVEGWQSYELWKAWATGQWN